MSRHVRQTELDRMLAQAKTEESKSDIRKRQHLMERSFARSTRYGFKRARWRGLLRVQIQEYLTSAIQNIMTLIRNKNHGNRKCQSIGADIRKPNKRLLVLLKLTKFNGK